MQWSDHFGINGTRKRECNNYVIHHCQGARESLLLVLQTNARWHPPPTARCIGDREDKCDSEDRDLSHLKGLKASSVIN